MKISYNWLKEYVELNISAKEVMRQLTFAGLDVAAEEKISNDTVFEIEITSNRPDWLGHVGVARELAALTQEKMKKMAVDTIAPRKKNPKSFTIEIKDKIGCPRYTGRIIRNVTIGSSPKWMRERLTNIGSRLINNGADITNYCLYETGQPMHSFDLDKLKGNKIVVRRAKKGEEIVTIDGVKRPLDKTILIIADAEKPVAIAGIMGGIDTEVSESTKNILLESAYFDPITIRRASRKLGLSTESNYRFERSVDVDNVIFSSARAALLYRTLTEGDIKEPCIDINYIKNSVTTIMFDPKKAAELTGANISAREVKIILTALGFAVQAKGKKLKVKVPSFRKDVKQEEDLVEEIARIWGYEKINASMPILKAHSDPAYPKMYNYKRRIRQIMQGLGLDEVITYSLLSKNAEEKANINTKDSVTIINPLSSEQESMRTSLLASFLKVINLNLNHKNKEIKIYEIGKIYQKQNKAYNERETLAIALCGKRYQDWQDHSRDLDFYDIKGKIEVLLEQLGITDYSLRRCAFNFYLPAESVEVVIKNETAGYFGRLDKKVLKNFDIGEDIYFGQLEIEKLAENAEVDYKFKTLAKYPSACRDIAIIVKEEVSAEDALQIIKEVAGDLAVKIDLFDVYKGNQIAAGFKSLAYSVEYQSKESTLIDEKVNSLHAAVQDALISRLNAVLR